MFPHPLASIDLSANTSFELRQHSSNAVSGGNTLNLHTKLLTQAVTNYFAYHCAWNENRWPQTSFLSSRDILRFSICLFIQIFPFINLEHHNFFIFQNAKAHQQLLEQQVFSLVAYFNSLQDQNIRQGLPNFSFNFSFHSTILDFLAFYW